MEVKINPLKKLEGTILKQNPNFIPNYLLIFQVMATTKGVFTLIKTQLQQRRREYRVPANDTFTIYKVGANNNDDSGCLVLVSPMNNKMNKWATKKYHKLMILDDSFL